MSDELSPGIEATQQFQVDGRLLTNVGGALSSSLLSTPGMIGMMEATAMALIHDKLPAGQVTVGFEVCVKHVRGAPEGALCTAHARLTEIDGRKFRFDVEVQDAEGATLGVGRHERRLIAVPD